MPLLNDLFDSGKESKLSRHDLPVIAKESLLTRHDVGVISKLENCPGKVRIFTEMLLLSNKFDFCLYAINATRDFNQDEWKEIAPSVLEIFNSDKSCKYHVYESAKVLRNRGLGEMVVFKLKERLKSLIRKCRVMPGMPWIDWG